MDDFTGDPLVLHVTGLLLRGRAHRNLRSTQTALTLRSCQNLHAPVETRPTQYPPHLSATSPPPDDITLDMGLCDLKQPPTDHN